MQFSPLYHGVSLLRSLTTGSISPGLLVDASYLVILAFIGLAIAGLRMQRLLLK